MSQLHVINHPMVQHKLTIMRDKETGSKDFRQLLKEIALLMGYEVTRDIPLEDVEIETYGGDEKMILLVIDMQKGLVDEDLYAFDTFIDRTVRLVDTARKNSIEVIFVQHDAGLDSGMSIGDENFEIIDQIAPKEGEKVFIKTINSCFGNNEFKEYVENLDDKRLMIVGLQTNYCIDCTVKSAFERGFEVIIPEGTNSTFDNDYMTGETTVRYYNEDVWEELVEAVTFEEAIVMLEE